MAGVGNGLGTAFLYRGLSSGRMGVVAPISGVGSALVPVVVGLVTGERPPLLVWVGIVCALPGIWLVAREPAQTDAGAAGSGALDGVLAGLGFGTLIAALAQVPESAGFAPLALTQVVARGTSSSPRCCCASPSSRGRRRPGGAGQRRPRRSRSAFMVAAQAGSLTVTAVLASLYPAFTVLLAASVLREHIHRAQALGLCAVAVAVSLVAVGGAVSPGLPDCAAWGTHDP